MPDPSEAGLYALGPVILREAGHLPDLRPELLRHVIRGMWDCAGFVGPNAGGYPVASLIASVPTAHEIADVIERVVGRRWRARPLHGAFWVGVSGTACAPWLRYLYEDSTVRSERKLAQARCLLGSLADDPILTNL